MVALFVGWFALGWWGWELNGVSGIKVDDCWIGAVGTGPVRRGVISVYLGAESVSPATTEVTLKGSVIASNDSCADRAFSPFK